MKFIFSYIKKLIKPSFKLSKEDKRILKKSNTNTNEILEVEEISIHKYDTHLNLLLSIYNESKLKKGKLYTDSGFISFNDLLDYKYLINQNSEEKVSFLYSLSKIIKTKPNSISHINERFSTKIFADIFATELNLSSKHLLDFFIFWRSDDYYSLKIPIHLFTKKIVLLSSKNAINSDLIKLLRRYINYNVNKHKYKTSHKDIEQIYRAITNNQFKHNSISFFLLPDYFGKKINHILINLNKEKTNSLSDILHYLSLSEKNKKGIEEYKITNALENINLLEVSIIILKFAANFKKKLRLTIIWQPYFEKYVCRKDYFGMFNENICIVYGILELLIEKKLIKKIPIETIVILTKRSYSSKPEIRLGSATTTLGDLGLKILNQYYGKDGKEKLLEIYNEINYKKVREKIDAIFDN